MSHTAFHEMNCAIARTLDVIGERWTPLIIRDLALGISRFDALQRDLGISRKVLTQRLARLAEHGVVERAAYQDNPVRYDYRLTAKGADLAMVLLAMKSWGDRWAFGGAGPPMTFRHEACGAITEPVVTCSECGERLLPTNVTPEIGPGYVEGPGTWEVPGAIARLRAQA